MTPRLKEIYRTNFSIDSKFKIFFLDNLSSDKMLKTLNKLKYFYAAKPFRLGVQKNIYCIKLLILGHQ